GAAGSRVVLMRGMDWRPGISSVIFLPIFIVPAKRVGNVQRALTGQIQAETATLYSQMQETLSVSGALLVKTFGRQADEIESFRQTSQRIRELNLRQAMVGRWFGMAMGLFGSITPAVVYWYGGHPVIGRPASLAHPPAF